VDKAKHNVNEKAEHYAEPLNLPFPLPSYTATSQQGSYTADAFELAQWSSLRDMLNLKTFNGEYQYEVQGGDSHSDSNRGSNSNRDSNRNGNSNGNRNGNSIRGREVFRWRLEEVYVESKNTRNRQRHNDNDRYNDNDRHTANAKHKLMSQIPNLATPDGNNFNYSQKKRRSLISFLTVGERRSVLRKLHRITASDFARFDEDIRNPLGHILDVILIAERRGHVPLLNGRRMTGPRNVAPSFENSNRNGINSWSDSRRLRSSKFTNSTNYNSGGRASSSSSSSSSSSGPGGRLSNNISNNNYDATLDDHKTLIYSVWEAFLDTQHTVVTLTRLFQSQPLRLVQELFAEYDHVPNAQEALEEDIMRLVVWKLKNEGMEENVGGTHNVGGNVVENVTVAENSQKFKTDENRTKCGGLQTGHCADSQNTRTVTVTVDPVGETLGNNNYDTDITELAAEKLNTEGHQLELYTESYTDLHSFDYHFNFPEPSKVRTAGRLTRLLLPEVDTLLDLVVALLLNAPE
jgi:hypothetical protein